MGLSPALASGAPPFPPDVPAARDAGPLSRRAIRGHAWAQRSLHTIFRKPSIRFTLGRARCIPPPFNLDSTTSLLALSMAPLPRGQPQARKTGYRI